MRRIFLWLQFVAATLVVVGVFLQAFSIAAYVRGAGDSALDMHEQIGFTVHLIEILVFLVALAAWWKQWGQIVLALSLPVIGTIQLIAVGDTDKDGGWVNGLHGMFALVVLVLAAVIAHRAMRALGLGKSTATT